MDHVLVPLTCILDARPPEPPLESPTPHNARQSHLTDIDRGRSALLIDELDSPGTLTASSRIGLGLELHLLPLLKGIEDL